MIKNVLPSLRQRAGPQRICSRQKSIRSGTARDSFSQTPHMRGKAKGDEFGLGQTRITPACAGKSLTIPKLTTRSWDYPRVCGEKAAFTFDFPKEMGLPPRMRGKAVSNSRLKHPDRITPACAGKSGWRSCCPGCNRDHPRVCGEKLMNRVKHIDPHRITPAYAGKSWSAHSLVSSLKDHPRVCGEKLMFCQKSTPS